MIVFPNAKINIGLNIVGKRMDGFHDIESVLYPILGLYDVLEAVEGSEMGFTSTGIKIPGGNEHNLCLDAYQLLKNDFKIPSVKIHLHKVIPIGAGLGGGSADAAFMLKLLNDLFELKLSDEKLIDYAKQLGSDCAFFIRNKPVYAYEKGDVFDFVDLDLNDYVFKIEYPDIHIGTAESYAGVFPHPSKKSLKVGVKQPIENWRNNIQNDFEASVFPNYPAIKELKENMYHKGAIYASMTGSGSAVYGIFRK